MAEKHWKLKKSRVTGHIPTLNEIDLDTIVLNQADGIAYIRKLGEDGDPDEVVALTGGGEIPADVWQSSVDGQIADLDPKTTPVDGDNFVIDDSAASNAKKKLSWANVKATLKTYFDTLYAAAGSLLVLGETSTTAYRGDRGKTAYDHSQTTHAPSDAVSLATVKADTDIASAISLKHASGSDAETASSIGALINGSAAQTPAVDTDRFAFSASSVLKHITWANIKATLKTYFDTLYVTLTTAQDITGPKTFVGTLFIRKEANSSEVLAIQASLLPEGKSVQIVVPATLTEAITTYTLPSESGTLALTSSIPSALTKAIGSEINAGADDAKYVTSKAIADSNVIRLEKAGQFSGLDLKSLPVSSDQFLIEDSAAAGAKKRIGWQQFLNSFISLTANNILTGANRFFNSLGIRVAVSMAGDQFRLIPNAAENNRTLTFTNTALTANRTQTYQDKDGDIALKSDIPTVEWVADTNGVKLKTDTDNVGIGVGSDATTKLSIRSTGQIGQDILVDGFLGYGIGTKWRLNQAATVGNATSFELSPYNNSSRGFLFYSEVTDATSGSELIKTTLGQNNIQLIILRDDGKIQITGDLILPSDGWIQWGATEEGAYRKGRLGNNLVEQRYESGVWVTKQITSA